MSRPIRVALYSCPMGSEAGGDDQLSELRQIADAREWVIVNIFTDTSSQSSGLRSDRAVLDGPLRAAAHREFDLVAIRSLDQFGASLREVIATAHQLCINEVHLYVQDQDLDTTETRQHPLYSQPWPNLSGR